MFGLARGLFRNAATQASRLVALGGATTVGAFVFSCSSFDGDVSNETRKLSSESPFELLQARGREWIAFTLQQYTATPLLLTSSPEPSMSRNHSSPSPSPSSASSRFETLEFSNGPATQDGGGGAGVATAEPSGKKCRVCRDLTPVRDLLAFYTQQHEGDHQQQPAGRIAAGAMAGAAAASAAGPGGASSSPSPAAATAPVAAASGAQQQQQQQQECPPDYFVLSRSTWNYLHTMAAYYPDKPAAQLKGDMQAFLRAFSETYPCESCREHMKEFMQRVPPDTSSRESLSLWFCKLHNDVNLNLNKPTFPCSIAALDTRWKDGPADGSCD